MHYKSSAHNQRSTAGRLATDRIWTDDGKRRQRDEPYDALNGTIGREKDARRVLPDSMSGTDVAS